MLLSVPIGISLQNLRGILSRFRYPWGILLKILGWAFAAAILIQIVPYGHSHTNPAATGEPMWDSPGTRELFHRACFDCHSNGTVYPWYSNVAPVSWLLARDVNGGRSHLNFTEWNKPQKHAKDVSNRINSGSMPPWFYLPMHAMAKLTADEKQALLEGAEKSLGPQATQ
jgi:mono/diheme cytochrome c family protein